MNAKPALLASFGVSRTATSAIPGDIPSLLAHAYATHVGEKMPSIKDAHIASPPTNNTSTTLLLALIADIPPLAPAAQALIDRARSILIDGPPLSMNIELENEEELPVAMYTLLQGTIWACLLAAGANPDLEAKLPSRLRAVLDQESRALWFLCRKFFFSYQVAEKDGECSINKCHSTSDMIWHHHHLYNGRLFMLQSGVPGFARAQMPPVIEVHSDGPSHIAMTPKGLWGWGENSDGQLGIPIAQVSVPTRISFKSCRRVARYEAKLPSWRKQDLVLWMARLVSRTWILTPAGLIMAGFEGWLFFQKKVKTKVASFHPVSLPTGFVPDHVSYTMSVVVVSTGDRQVIGGRNHHGQLGLGHRHRVHGLAELPFHADKTFESPSATVFLSGQQLLFAGRVPLSIAQSGLLPGFAGNTSCLTATPLRFSQRIKGFLLTTTVACWVTAGQTYYSACDGRWFIVSFEATSYVEGYCFKNRSGQWYTMRSVGQGGVAGMVQCAKPKRSAMRWPISSVDVEAWEARS
ncbi:hypothetical protein J8273_0649 [Carpediemonas membranifera]|uniref:Uncharacterized protein n=1 Tax=Carpediemonas membranifera TaxID=201153 RepID=A0A8J6BAH1_9EUKA|nr:hypothetical protein J8273_0649 [Carpediemonas membranifera]|eukprot:KAG9397519.1 hypothetical protein J8273_0649 [Carpediemonas membranifera]